MTAYTILQNVTAVQAGPLSTGSQIVKPEDVGLGASQGQQFVGVLNGVGSCSATIQVMGSNDKVNFVNIGSIALTAASADLTPGVATTTAGGMTSTRYKYFGGYVSAISGTNASAALELSA